MLWNKVIGAKSGATPTGIQYVGGKAVGNDAPASPWVVSLTDLAGGVGTQPSTGDIVVVYFGATRAADLTMGFDTGGYTELFETYVSAGTADNMLVGYKFMSDTPDTVVSVTASDTARGWSLAVMVFRGVSQADPFSAALTSATGVTATADPPAITPGAIGSFVVSGVTAADATNPTPLFTSSDLAGFVSAEGFLVAGNVVGLGYKAWTSGEFNPAAFGGNTGLNSWAAVSLSLRPAT